MTVLNSATRRAYQSALDPRTLAPTRMTSNLEILAYEYTELGPLCLRRRELLGSPGTVVTEITLDHQLLMSSRYAEEGLRRTRRHLAPGGVLGVWFWAESSDFSRALRQVFDQVRVEPVTFFNDLVDEERTDWLFFAR